jgi:hypothetical protein
MKFGAIDYSMSCPCVTLYESDQEFSFLTCKSHYLTANDRFVGSFGKNITGYLYVPPTPIRQEDQMDRFLNIGKWAFELVKSCDSVLIEDYSMGSKGKVFHIAENTALLKYFMHMGDVSWSALPPTSLKKFATGKGNADKNKMYEQFQQETNFDLKGLFGYKGKNVCSPISDIVDSYYLAKYLSTKATTVP